MYISNDLSSSSIHNNENIKKTKPMEVKMNIKRGIIFVMMMRKTQAKKTFFLHSICFSNFETHLLKHYLDILTNGMICHFVCLEGLKHGNHIPFD
jgi:hypothetical protein